MTRVSKGMGRQAKGKEIVVVGRRLVQYIRIIIKHSSLKSVLSGQREQTLPLTNKMTLPIDKGSLACLPAARMNKMGK